MPDLSSTHNNLVPEVVRNITKTMVGAGGTSGDLMAAAESIVLGILLINEKLFGAQRPATIEALNEMSLRIEERLAAHSAGGEHG